MHVLLAAPTLHDIFGLLYKQFGKVKITLLSNKTLIDFERELKSFKEEVRRNVKRLKGNEYFLLLVGHPALNILAFAELIKAFKDIKLLIFDPKKKRYIITR